MKTLKIAVLSLFVAVGTIVNAGNLSDIPSDYALDQLRSFITTELQDVNLDEFDDMEVKVSFYLTPSNEIIVLKTNGAGKYMDATIKGKMNYLKVPVDGLDHNETYHIKVKFEKRK